MERANIIQANSENTQQNSSWAIMAVYSYNHKDTFYNTDTDIAPSLPRERYTLDGDVYQRIIDADDIINLTVSHSKSSFLSTAQATLLGQEDNYLAIFGTLDHVFVWMGTDPLKRQELLRFLRTSRASSPEFSQVLSGKDSGLKFYGRINSIRQNFVTSPQGIKTLRYSITMKGFYELQTMFYFNQFLAPAGTRGSIESQKLDILDRFQAKWKEFLLQRNGYFTGQSAIALLVDTFLGSGKDSRLDTPNSSIAIPAQVGAIFGVRRSDLAYDDIMQTILGIQQFSGNTYHPSNVSSFSSTIVQTNQDIIGSIAGFPELMNESSIYNAIKSYSNEIFNETFTTLKVNNKDQIVPQLIVRQIPQTTERYSGSLPATSFLTLPTWVIDSTRLISYNIGVSDSPRINYVQIYAPLAVPERTLNQQMAAQALTNRKVDEDSIRRHGLRTLIRQSMTDPKFVNEQKLGQLSELASDFYINQHLKLNGTILLTGVQEPISIGDNVDFQDFVLHIESVTHQYQISGSGGTFKKQFMTTLELSNGVRRTGTYVNSDAQNFKRGTMKQLYPYLPGSSVKK